MELEHPEHMLTGVPAAPVSVAAVALPPAAADTTDHEVVDFAGLYRYSSLIDAMRDATKAYQRPGATAPVPQTIQQLVKQYNDLRAKVLQTLRTDLAAEGTACTVELTDDADVHAVHLAATTLARWADAAFQTPNYLAQIQLHTIERTVKVVAATRQGNEALRSFGAPPMPIDAGAAAAAVEPGTTVTDSRTGQYL
jgi:hypothetical protein